MADPAEDRDRVARYVGRRVRHARHAAGLTQAELGSRLGVAVPRVSLIESGANVTIRTVVGLAAALEIEAWELLYGYELGWGES